MRTPDIVEESLALYPLLRDSRPDFGRGSRTHPMHEPGQYLRQSRAVFFLPSDLYAATSLVRRDTQCTTLVRLSSTYFARVVLRFSGRERVFAV